MHELRNGDYWERHGIKKPKNGLVEASPAEDASFAWKTVRDALSDLPAPSDTQDEAVMNHWTVLGAEHTSDTREAGSTGRQKPSKQVSTGFPVERTSSSMTMADYDTTRFGKPPASRHFPTNTISKALAYMQPGRSETPSPAISRKQ